MRIIPKIDIKNDYVVKSINLEGVRKVGNPNDLAQKYYHDGADEIIFMDVVASLYGRNNIFDLIKKFSKDIFIPITVGGGIRTLQDIETALYSGADKVSINSAGLKNENFLKEASKEFGSSTIVSSIEVKKIENQWYCYYEFGRENSQIKLLDWISKINQIGCAEVLLTSIDKEGTRNGFDLELIEKIHQNNFNIPIIYSGGCGNIDDIINIKKYILEGDGISLSSILHYNLENLKNIKKCLWLKMLELLIMDVEIFIV